MSMKMGKDRKKGVHFRDDGKRLFFNARLGEKKLYTTKIKTEEEGGRCYDIVQLLKGKGHSKLNFEESDYSALNFVNLRCKISNQSSDNTTKTILTEARRIKREPAQWVAQEEEIVRSGDAQRQSEGLKVDDKAKNLKNQRPFAAAGAGRLKSPFEDILITLADVTSLDEGGWLTMNTVDFFLEYLRRSSQSITLHPLKSFVFQFVEAFATDGDGSSRYEKVAQCMGEINIFDFSYVFLPVITRQHWSLFILCDIGVADYPRSRVLHLDSLQAGGYHSGVGEMIKTFLLEEGKRHPNPVDHSRRLQNLEIETVDVPQQPNSADCGVYVLYYAKRFMESVFHNEISGKIPWDYSFLTRGWFDAETISRQRVEFKRVILDICAYHPPTAREVEFSWIDYCLQAAGDMKGKRREGDYWLELPYLDDEFDGPLEGFQCTMSEGTEDCTVAVVKLPDL